MEAFWWYVKRCNLEADGDRNLKRVVFTIEVLAERRVIYLLVRQLCGEHDSRVTSRADAWWLADVCPLLTPSNILAYLRACILYRLLWGHSIG